MQCLTRTSPAPVLQELILMQFRPRHDETNVPATERAVDQLERVDTDLRLAIGIQGMKVRRVVIVEVHRDHEPEKATDRGHLHPVIAPPVDANASPRVPTSECSFRVPASVSVTTRETLAVDDERASRRVPERRPISPAGAGARALPPVGAPKT